MKEFEVEKWYAVTEPGYICANGTPYQGAMRLGTENKLMVHLDGGGASWNEFTARKPDELYSSYVPPIDALYKRGGMYSLDESNPFRNWNIINVCYASGDFHVGNGEFEYTDTTGAKKILYHHGFRNFQMVMEKSRKHMSEPEQIIIFGESAGGFAAAALAGEIQEMFPTCQDVTCLVDGAMASSDMRKIVKDVWKAKEEFYLPVISNNITVDWLTAQYKKYGEKMKFLFVSSVRDWVLSFFQDVFDKEELHYTKGNGLKYQQDLKLMCEKLRKQIPTIGICIYDFPADKVPAELELTQHTILLENSIFDKLSTDDICPIEWVRNAVGGDIKSYGLKLLI